MNETRYHAVADFGQNKRRFWWNHDREAIIRELVIPLVSRQVTLVNRRGKKALFNFSGVSYVNILATSNRLNRVAKGRPPSELTDPTFILKHDVTASFLNEIRHVHSNQAIQSILSQALTQPTNRIFVIMKFGDQFLDSAYQGVVKPLGTEFGYEVLRANEIEDSGRISQQILEGIAQSALILAELSGERPNSYYEAGYAHALGKEMVFAIKADEQPHFDLADHRFIKWNTEADFRAALRKRFTAIRERRAA